MPTTEGRPTGDPELTERCARLLADELGDVVPLNDIIDEVARAQRELADEDPEDLSALVVAHARQRLQQVPRARGPEPDVADDDPPDPPIPFPRAPEGDAGGPQSG